MGMASAQGSAMAGLGCTLQMVLWRRSQLQRAGHAWQGGIGNGKRILFILSLEPNIADFLYRAEHPELARRWSEISQHAAPRLSSSPNTP